MARRMVSRLGVLIAVAAVPLLLWGVLPLVSHGDPSPGQIQKKIDRKERQLLYHRGRERVLTSDIAGYTRQINSLQSDITRLQTRQVRIEADLSAKRAELARTQERLRQERLRLVRLRARLAEARTALANRLVALYKADRPDIVTVILESDGFADLLERTEFMERVSAQDQRIIQRVRSAKADATATAEKLDTLESRQQKLTDVIQHRRDEVVAVKSQLVDKRGRFQSARSEKSSALASTRERRHQLQDDLGSLRAQQAKITAALQAAAGSGGGGNLPAGPVRPGSGGLIWPVNGPITSPFCESRAWESCHPGIDIGVPTGTPIRAAASGKVVLLQGEGASGGYGNFTCLQHTASMSTCYAHQRNFAVSMGQSVKQGQVIGYSDCTGRCFGPHLHFEVRINGSVVNPMNYL
jgi:murein DD-endopeptidase MepM/ murein hydrolase activator NlpD